MEQLSFECRKNCVNVTVLTEECNIVCSRFSIRRKETKKTPTVEKIERGIGRVEASALPSPRSVVFYAWNRLHAMPQIHLRDPTNYAEGFINYRSTKIWKRQDLNE